MRADGVRDERDEALVVDAERCGFVGPLGAEVVGADAALGVSGVGCDFALDGRTYVERGVVAVLVAVLVETSGEFGVDFFGSFGEQLDQLGRHAGDLGLPLLDGGPCEAVAVGDLGSEGRLVHATEGGLVRHQLTSVQGAPSPV